MSKEFLGVDPHAETSKNDIKTDLKDKFETDVPDVYADGVKQIGIEKFPIFKVTHDEFHGNMSASRKRQRYKSGSAVQQYMTKTRNSGRPFYVRTTDVNGKEYERKIR